MLSSASGLVIGTTIGATIDSGAPYDGVRITSPGVWYTFFGNGLRTSFHTNDIATNYETLLSVYTGHISPIVELQALANDHHPWLCDRSSSTYCSDYDFRSTLNQQYYLLVHGWGGAAGTFGLSYAGVEAASVPEPSTLAIFALGLMGFASRRFKKKA
ncbi:PEP-CTERM sorting domain-containing protein [Colwellia sp. BRX10-4]|uniref:PEP-CTERM sorting domain-containing protein n=1 Tax=Colwellia sp. BRX10-4 TaxID=2759843 RepID=UPI00217518CC|nr:PEP-CTERM sorting domain-containing protein [Colwellia sp. BRX10-4]